jgi:cysteine desulfurase/selenocysteine lyase
MAEIDAAQRLRYELPCLNDLHYFDYAKTAPILASTALLLQQFVQEAAKPYVFRWQEWREAIEKTRASVARLINASTDEIAFVRSTSNGLSLIANSIRWNGGDRILYPADEFPSNRFVWDNLAEKDVHAEAVAVEKGIPFAEQLAQMDLSRVRLVAVSAVSYWDGRIHDIKKIVRICHAQGVLVVVDAIQALGAVSFDVRQAGCDFMTSGGQKWLFAPMGSGFLYICRERLEELFVADMGWMSVKDHMLLEAKEFRLLDSARRFESGTVDVMAIAGLGSSIDSLEKIGLPAIYRAIRLWNERICQGLNDLGYVLLHEKTQSGIAAVHLKSDQAAEALTQRLAQEKIIVTQRKNYLRISAHASVEQKDLDILFRTMKRAAGTVK